MKIEQIEKLIGKRVVANNMVSTITGVHLYIGQDRDIKSVRVHLYGLEGYFRLSKLDFLTKNLEEAN